MAGSLVFAGIAPHPPLLVPEVGGERITRVKDSQAAMRDFARRLLATEPDTVVVISPHSPLDPHSFTARAASELRGDFRDFGVPQVRLTFANDLELLDSVERSATAEGVSFIRLARDHPLDHGALVPLYYLQEAGWRGPVAVFAFTMQDTDKHLAFGRAIAQAAASINRRVALVASGDLSHRLIVGGPYPFEPTAHLFDEQIVDAIATGNAARVTGVDDDLRHRAGECGYRSILVALGGVDENLRDHEVLSYEGPFGVGYMVAVLLDANRE
ncbi:MAG TPA: AmmeMemoRadiSam system protein B [Blastocatellia bacterium]|nr:AmmeMemoRadiSam system protein B [Blastocatellia bacterium]